MKRGVLLAGAMSVVGARAMEGALAPAEPGDGKRPKPVATIGTMAKGSSADKIALHHKLKMRMKEDARRIRYEQAEAARATQPPKPEGLLGLAPVKRSR